MPRNDLEVEEGHRELLLGTCQQKSRDIKRLPWRCMSGLHMMLMAYGTAKHQNWGPMRERVPIKMVPSNLLLLEINTSARRRTWSQQLRLQEDCAATASSLAPHILNKYSPTQPFNHDKESIICNVDKLESSWQEATGQAHSLQLNFQELYFWSLLRQWPFQIIKSAPHLLIFLVHDDSFPLK